jgi:YVTN family beta-propeller protein
MSSRRIGAAAIAVLTGTTWLAIGTAVPAVADAIQQPLSITSVGDVVVDGVHKRIFVSDPAGGTVIATDYSGNQIGAVQVDDANSLALALDSSRLYVASSSESAVFALDTTTLAQTARYATGVEPYDVAVAGDRIWFSYASKLGTIDPSTETPTVLLDQYDTRAGAAELVTAEARPNRIGVASWGKTAVIDVSGDTVTEVASQATDTLVTDVAISPDGEQIATTVEGGYGITLRDVSDMTASRRLQYGGVPAAVDFAADGTVVGGNLTAVAPNLFVFAPSGELIKSIMPPNRGRGLTRAVAWEPNGDRLFAVSANGTALKFNAYTDAKLSPTTVTLAGPPTSVPGAPVTFDGTLTASLSFPTGITVGVSRDGTSLGTAAVGSDGSFSFTDTPPAEGLATYQVSYAGDDSHLSSAATASVTVARATATVTVIDAPSTVIPGAPIAVTGRLTSWPSLPTGVSVSVSRSGTPAGVAAVDANSDWSYTDTAPAAEGTLTYQFSYAGDDTHLPATASTTVQVSRTASTVTLSGPSSATRAKALTLTGTLASPLGLPAGTKVTISKSDLDHTAGTTLGTATVGANGAFSFADTPQTGGTVTYRASYAGDTTHTPASATKSVAVSRTTPALTINNNGKVYAYNQAVTFTGYLGSTYKNRTVEIWADPAGNDQARRLLKRATVNSAGKITASIKLTRDTTMTAVFTGDARTAPRTATATVGTKVSLSLSLANYYKTAKINGTTYRYFRTKKNAYFNKSMTSASTRKVFVQLQRYSGGKWKNWDQRYFDATDLLYLPGAGLTGVKLRVRIAYIKSGSGDTFNTTTWTPYQYFTFTK